MKKGRSKIFAQFTAGIFGGTIFGFADASTRVAYGMNDSCWSFYESCGYFDSLHGLIINSIIGSIIGIIILNKVKILRYSKVAIYLLLGSFILPFLYGLYLVRPPIFDGGYLLLVLTAVLGFMLLSAISSLLITGIINYRSRGTRI